MSDDNDESVYSLGQEEAQEIINWAVDVAATITLMYHEDEAEDDMEALLKLDRYIKIVERIYETMPEVISDPAHDIAVSIIDRVEYEEEQVEEFLEQIKDL